MAEGYSFEEAAKQWQLLKFGYSDRPFGKSHVKTAVLKPTLGLTARDNSRLVALLAFLKGQADIECAAESDSRAYTDTSVFAKCGIVGREVFDGTYPGCIRKSELKTQARRPIGETELRDIFPFAVVNRYIFEF